MRSVRNRLSVSLEGGSAVLRGTVPTAAAAHEAETLAKKVSPSRKVVDLLTIEQQEKDEVYESGLESFPASDPPSWNS